MNAEMKATKVDLRSMSHPKSVNGDWRSGPPSVVVGKDVLELLSTSMYVDPMTMYREYVQNAADAVDEARRAGFLQRNDAGVIEISVDPARRNIRIRDNGIAIKAESFATQLTTLGASSKRGTSARGFRGVGRLAGLGYAQELIFRSRADGESTISEMRWDCRQLLAALRDAEFKGGLTDIIQQIVAVRSISPEGYPIRFFEIELTGVIRHKNDRLLNPPAVAEYLSQVAPVPFAPDFRFGPEIEAALAACGDYSHVHIFIDGIEGPIYRPHRDSFEVSGGVLDEFATLELLHIPGSEGGVAAIAWLLHHGYTGAIPNAALIKGLRLRAGNIQVGDGALLEDLFAESRFNAWSVGEVHVLDRRVVPNGRRDHFQSNVHFSNILNHLAPAARNIAHRCRTNSIRRNLLRQFELQHVTVKEKISILSQGALGQRERSVVERTARVSLAAMGNIADKDGLDTDGSLKSTISADEKKLSKALAKSIPAPSLATLPAAKRKMYEHLFGLVYECSTNRSAAKALVDRILLKIA